jgi:hypothetical protein
MKAAFCSLVLTPLFTVPLRADLTIVYSTTVQPASHSEKAQATPSPVATATNMTIKVKGDKARIDASPHVTAIFDGTTGQLVNLLNDQKTVVRVSPDKMRAIGDMLNKYSGNKAGADKPKLTPTGQREAINGYDTEQYTSDGPDFRAIYWIAPNYPNGAAVLAQLQSIKSDLWDAANTKMPDFRDFPGLPIQMRMIVGKGDHAADHDAKENQTGEHKGKGNHPGAHTAKENRVSEHAAASSGHGIEITSIVTAVSLDSIADSEFTVPANFTEAKLPDIFNKSASPSVSPIP